MISALGVACFLLVWQWMPVSGAARLAAYTGVHQRVPLERRLLERRNARRRRTRGQPATARLLQMLVSELAAGIVTRQAFEQVLGVDCDSPDALAATPPTADLHLWQDVAHVWRASEIAGFSMAVALQRIHAQALIDQEVAREVQANAAAPRFAVLTLVMLPVLAWVAAGATGAQPVEFLTRTPVGWLCLLVGGLLYGGAILWMRTLTRGALA